MELAKQSKLHGKQQELIDSIASGATRHEIAGLFGVDVKTVNNWCNRLGIPKPSIRDKTMHRSHKWAGGRKVIQGGYIKVILPANHKYLCMADSNRFVLEHRLVMAYRMGRPIDRSETVHHVNGNRSDNRIENLQLMRSSHVRGEVLVCACCGSTNIVPLEIKKD
jgi:hypothetical protein